MHAGGLAGYIFNVGYASRQWTDVNLSFFSDTHPFHRSTSIPQLESPSQGLTSAVILARSPYLAGMLELVRPGSTVLLRFDDEYITNEVCPFLLRLCFFVYMTR